MKKGAIVNAYGIREMWASGWSIVDDREQYRSNGLAYPSSKKQRVGAPTVLTMLCSVPKARHMDIAHAQGETDVMHTSL